MPTNETPLMAACVYSNVAAVEVLLRLGADRHRKDWRGMDAFAYLQDCRTKLLRFGESIEQCDECRALLEAPLPVRPAKAAKAPLVVDTASVEAADAAMQALVMEEEAEKNADKDIKQRYGGTRKAKGGGGKKGNK
jgi:hypothetical protein